MRGFAMELMRRRIARGGYHALSYSYPSMRLTLGENAERLVRYLRGLNVTRLHLVGHSLGGLIVLRALNNAAGMAPGRVVLVGTPCAGSHAASRLQRIPGGRTVLGRSLNESLESPLARPPGRDIGVVAGSVPIGLGQIVDPSLPRPNDGAVSVEETRIAGMRDHVILPVSHSGMLVSRTVARQICAFLRDGTFARSRERQDQTSCR